MKWNPDNKTRKEEWLVQPVFCIVDTGSCLCIKIVEELARFSVFQLIGATEGWGALVSIEVDRHPGVVHCREVAVGACNHGDEGYGIL